MVGNIINSNHKYHYFINLFKIISPTNEEYPTYLAFASTERTTYFVSGYYIQYSSKCSGIGHGIFHKYQNKRQRKPKGQSRMDNLGSIKDGQSRETGTIRYTRRRTKTNKRKAQQLFVIFRNQYYPQCLLNYILCRLLLRF